MAINDQTKTVLFVTSQSAVSDYLYDTFSNSRELRDQYYIEGAAATRESAISTAQEQHPDLIIFFERTTGIMSISETLYNLRLSGARLIYISSQRAAGDLVLEAAVSYGIYDIILSSSITKDQIVEIILNPRDFRDVSLMHRVIDIPDSGVGVKNFKIEGLDHLKQFSTRIDDDFLTSPEQRAAENQKERINKAEENKSIGDRLYKQKEVKHKSAPKRAVKPIPKPSDGLGDLEGGLFD